MVGETAASKMANYGRILGVKVIESLNGSLKYIAVQDGIEDWAAYYGPAEWTDEEVACNGMKLVEQAAKPIFPILDIDGYRR